VHRSVLEGWYPVVRTVSAQSIREQADDVLEMVRSSHQPVIIEDDDKTQVVMMSREEYERLLVADREEWDRLWAVVDEVHEQNAHLDPDEVLRDVTKVVKEVRKELYDEWRSDQSGR
jgi:PHD/YefM family antitoxin component YafN of YafNO toxin-antitoxin module